MIKKISYLLFLHLNLCGMENPSSDTESADQQEIVLEDAHGASATIKRCDAQESSFINGITSHKFEDSQFTTDGTPKVVLENCYDAPLLAEVLTTIATRKRKNESEETIIKHLAKRTADHAEKSAIEYLAALCGSAEYYDIPLLKKSLIPQLVEKLAKHPHHFPVVQKYIPVNHPLNTTIAQNILENNQKINYSITIKQFPLFHGAVGQCAVDPAGKFFLLRTFTNICETIIGDTTNYHLIHTIRHQRYDQNIEINKSGTRLAVHTDYDDIQILDTKTWNPIETISIENGRFVFDHDNLIILHNDERTLSIYDTINLKYLEKKELNAVIEKLPCSPRNDWLPIFHIDRIKDTNFSVINIKTGKVITIINYIPLSSKRIAQFHPKKNLLLAIDCYKLRCWSLDSQQEVPEELPSHDSYINDATYNNDGTLLATCSNDSTIKIWDAESYDLLMGISCKTIPAHVAFAPNNNHLITGYQPGDGQAAKIISVSPAFANKKNSVLTLEEVAKAQDQLNDPNKTIELKVIILSLLDKIKERIKPQS